MSVDIILNTEQDALAFHHVVKSVFEKKKMVSIFFFF